VLIDQKTEDKFYPIKNILTKNSNIVFSVNNSHLSEFGALGFEYGYSISNQNYLTIWEAQFGDFANGAQVMIDNFISSGELKWGVQSGLVLLLPNGMDG
jgi:2-oxoglutarate dehydrogenase complex dehydrogenase (E1) component-like enzyme